MSIMNTGSLSKEEFFERFRLALSYYDNYIMHGSFVPSKDHCAERALKMSGIITHTKATDLVRILMRALNDPLGEEKISESMRLAWEQYSSHA